MQTCSARSAPHAIAGDAQRELVLEGFDGSVPAVGHVGVDRAGAIGMRGSSHASGDGLVIRERVLCRAAAEAQVVHGPAARRRDPVRSGLGQRAQQNIGDALRGFDVARGHRGGRQRVDHRPFGSDHADGPQDARGERNIVLNQAAEHVHRRGERDREVRVDRSLDLRGGTGEIDHRASVRRWSPRRGSTRARR